MKIRRRLPAFHFELLFPYLFSFVEISAGWRLPDGLAARIMDVLQPNILEMDHSLSQRT
jgi:hypothetical protein